MSEQKSSGGIGFCGLLTLIFITLKLTNYIDWSWWWVWSPIWIPVALFAVLCAIIFFATGLAIILDDWKRTRQTRIIIEDAKKAVERHLRTK